MSLNVSAERLSELEFPCFAFLFIAEMYLLLLRAIFHRLPHLYVTAVVLTPPKLDLQRDLKVCALSLLNAEPGSVATH